MFDNQTKWKIEELITVIRDDSKRLVERAEAGSDLADIVETYISECDDEKE